MTTARRNNTEEATDDGDCHEHEPGGTNRGGPVSPQQLSQQATGATLGPLSGAPPLLLQRSYTPPSPRSPCIQAERQRSWAWSGPLESSSTCSLAAPPQGPCLEASPHYGLCPPLPRGVTSARSASCPDLPSSSQSGSLSTRRACFPPSCPEPCLG
ncbi:unnamed protein product [Gadus morhua 'NCC']